MTAFDSDLVFITLAACMVGGFWLAGFFRAELFAAAPERGGVVGWGYFLAALGLLVPQAVMMAVDLPPDSPAVHCVELASQLAWPAALVIWLRLGFHSPENALRLGLRGRANRRSLRVAFWGIPTGLVLVQGIGVVGLAAWALFGHKEPTAGHAVFKKMQEHPDDVGAMVVNAIAAILLAPVCEESMFRGLLQTGLSTGLRTRLRHWEISPSAWRWLVLLLVGLVFGAVHFGAVPVPMLPALVGFGVLLGWAYEYTGCFWVPVTIHMGFNAVSFAAGVWQVRHP